LNRLSIELFLLCFVDILDDFNFRLGFRTFLLLSIKWSTDAYLLNDLPAKNLLVAVVDG
jgi:hypothetical protein